MQIPNFIGALTLLCAAASAQTTVSITATQDGTLYDTDDGGIANGAGDEFFAGANAVGNIRRGIMQFDVAAAVPAGATIVAASVRVNMNMVPPGGSPGNYSLHRVSEAWGEGSSAAPGTGGAGTASSTGDATWLHTFFPGMTWITPGGDFNLTPSATLLFDFVGFYDFSSGTLTADVQDMLDNSASDAGWILKSDTETGSTARRFNSREAANMAVRPTLEITFTTDSPGTNYCGPAVPNSSGMSGTISATGSTSVAANNLTLIASDLPTNQFGFMVTSMTQGFIVGPGGSQGNLCLGGAIGRFSNMIMNSGAGGTYSIALDLNAVPQPSGPVAVMAGETFNFQAWFRDNNPTNTSNFTDGISITFN